MDPKEDPGSPGWTSFLMQTEDVARAVVAAASGATVRSPRPSIVFSTRDESSNSLHKLQQHVARLLRGFSPPPDVKKKAYNPEILTSQKRQWAKFQMQSLDHRSPKEPSRIFESMVVVGLHPNADLQAIRKHMLERSNEDLKKPRSLMSFNNQVHAEPVVEPQVLFVYPPEKQLPLNYKDLLSFCFPGGPEVHAVERTPSMSALNEILLGQEQLKQSDLSFVFRLQVADDSTLYGCCVLIEELLQRPSGLISLLQEEQAPLPLSRHVLTTSRCYCILSRLPFFDLHFGVLRSIFTEERLKRLTKGTGILNLLAPIDTNVKDENDDTRHKNINDASNGTVKKQSTAEDVDERGSSEPSQEVDTTQLVDNCENDSEFEERSHYEEVIESDVINKLNQEVGHEAESASRNTTGNDCSVTGSEAVINEPGKKCLPEAVSPLLRYQQYEGSESSASLQGSPCERTFRSDNNSEPEEPTSSGHEDSNDHDDILDWAEANRHGSLQILCAYYKLPCPARGSTLTFQPLEHLHPLEFQRPGETMLHVAGSTVDLRSCNTSLDVAEAHSALSAEEEATALSVWTVACLCGSLRLEHVLTLFAGALLEKQIVVVCSNLGVLSASVLSIIPLIRPYQWQSLLMPVLPNDMLDFLDAPVPYIVGIRNKTAEIQSKLANVILVDVKKNQVKSPSMPPLPQHKELLSSLSPYHAKLVGESYLARKRPIYECTDVQVEAAKGFLAVLRSYLDSLCSNLRSHTITNVQSNDDKVSLLLKESFIDSFLYRDRPFMKLFVDTQLFSVQTDLVLSFYQKD